MLQAIDVVTGLPVASHDADREGRYLCPECRALVGLCVGSIKVPYFAHYARRLCSLSQPESPRHRALKWLCKSFFAPLDVEWEAPLGCRRADAVVARSFAVECQASPLSVEEWIDRTANHNRHGYPVLWLWDVKRLCRKNTLAEAYALERSGRPVLAAAEIRRCHEESGGMIHVADKHTVAPCRLDVVMERRNLLSADARFFPQAVRRMVFLADGTVKSWREFEGSQGLRLVRLEEPRTC